MNRLQIVNGEICYLSEENDQSYGMWVPVNYDTPHNFKECEYLVPESSFSRLEEDLADTLDCLSRESCWRKKHCKTLIDIAQEALNMAGKAQHGDWVFVGADPKFAKQSLQKRLDEFKSMYKDE